MAMYNLIEYSSNYSQTTKSLWFYSKDEVSEFNANISNTNDFKSFKYKTKLSGNTVADGANRTLKNITIAASQKFLSNFQGSLEIPLINFKKELKLKWTKYDVLTAARNENEIHNDDNANNFVSNIKQTKLYVPVVTLPVRDNQKLSKLLNKGFER